MTRFGKFVVTFVVFVIVDVIVRVVFGGETPIARELGDYMFLSMLVVWLFEGTDNEKG